MELTSHPGNIFIADAAQHHGSVTRRRRRAACHSHYLEFVAQSLEDRRVKFAHAPACTDDPDPQSPHVPVSLDRYAACRAVCSWKAASWRS